MRDFFKIGIIIGAHGTRGDVRVLPTTFDAGRFGLLKTVDIKATNTKTAMQIEQIRFNKNLIILKLQGVDSCDEALRLKGGEIIIPREAALPLEEGEYYAADLYDMAVYADSGEELGTITDIITTGANDVYVVSKQGAKDLLLPAIRQCVLDVDVKGGVMRVHIMEGLR